MTDTQLKCFLYAAKFENFTKAAEALYTSQPVLGRNISRDIVSEEWNRANLGGHRALGKHLFAFEVALLIADELTA